MATRVDWLQARHTRLALAPRGREMPDGARVGTEAALVFSADDVIVIEGSRARIRRYLENALRALDAMDDEARAEAGPDAPPWAVGDPDPTPEEDLPGGAYCGEASPLEHGGVCTWGVEDHPRWHVAGNGARVVAVWPVDPGRVRDDDYTPAAVARDEAAPDEAGQVMERLDKTFGKLLPGDVLLPDGVDAHQRTLVTGPRPAAHGMVEFEVEYPSGSRLVQQWPARGRHIVLRPRWKEGDD